MALIQQKSILQKWVGLSVTQRCRVLRFDYDLHIRPATLHTYYKQCKIKFSAIVKQNSAKLRSVEELIEK